MIFEDVEYTVPAVKQIRNMMISEGPNVWMLDSLLPDDDIV